MTYPNDDIPLLVKELEGADQVVGARTSEQGTHKLLRVPAKWFIRRLAQYLAKAKIPDLNSGFRAFRREVAVQYLHMLPAGFSCVTTMTMTFLANGYTVKYIPIEYKERAGELEVPLVHRHPALRPAGVAADLHVQPDAGVRSARRAASCSLGLGKLGLRHRRRATSTSAPTPRC